MNNLSTKFENGMLFLNIFKFQLLLIKLLTFQSCRLGQYILKFRNKKDTKFEGIEFVN